MCISIPNSTESSRRESALQRHLSEHPRRSFTLGALLLVALFPLLSNSTSTDAMILFGLEVAALLTLGWISEWGEGRRGYTPPTLIRISLAFWLSMAGGLLTLIGSPPFGVILVVLGSSLIISHWNRRRFWMS
jgi:hypothetical protein